MQKTLTSMSTQLHEYSKCQVEQGKKLTEAVTQLTSSYNAIKLAARSTSDPENSDNSDSGENDDENDTRNRVTIHETDGSLYNEIGLAANHGTLWFSAATTGKPKDDPMGSVFKQLPKFYLRQ